MISREEALQFVNEQIENKNIVKHMLATEVCMHALARHLKNQNLKIKIVSGDEVDTNKWALVGILHDADYTPGIADRRHGLDIVDIVRERGLDVPEDVLHAIAAHNAEHTGVQPESLMDWAIFCCDSLTGLIVATALVRPDKKLASVTVKSVMKKFKSPSFAAGTRREDITLCDEKLGIPLEEFVGICLEAMQSVSDRLGL